MNKNYLIIGSLLILIVGLILFLVGNRKSNIETPLPSLSTTTPSATIIPVTEFKSEDLVIGTGAEAVSGKTVTVNYLGTLQNGTKFDSSYDHGTPFTFHLGAGEVIKGWDQGVAGMKVGGKRRLTIPSELGYGPAGAGSAIPPNATLIFEVELLKVE